MPQKPGRNYHVSGPDHKRKPHLIAERDTVGVTWHTGSIMRSILVEALIEKVLDEAGGDVFIEMEEAAEQGQKFGIYRTENGFEIREHEEES